MSIAVPGSPCFQFFPDNLNESQLLDNAKYGEKSRWSPERAKTSLGERRDLDRSQYLEKEFDSLLEERRRNLLSTAPSMAQMIPQDNKWTLPGRSVDLKTVKHYRPFRRAATVNEYAQRMRVTSPINVKGSYLKFFGERDKEKVRRKITTDIKVLSNKSAIPSPSSLATVENRPLQTPWRHSTRCQVPVQGKSKKILDMHCKSTKEIVAFGRGDSGQLASTTVDDTKMPLQVQHAHRDHFLQISTGNSHTLVIEDRGNVYACGRGDEGQVGNKSLPRKQPKPQRIKGLMNVHIEYIACGAHHCVAVTSKDNRSVFTWGRGAEGQLGHGDNNNLASPRPVASLKHCPSTKCSAGEYHTIVCSSSGELWGFGANESGQLGIGSTESTSLPVSLRTPARFKMVQSNANHNIALTKKGRVYYWGHGDGPLQKQPFLIASLSGCEIVDVACGALHCAVVDSNGKVWLWGNNMHGQLGVGKNSSPKSSCPVTPSYFAEFKISLCKIACGARTTYAVSDTGCMYGWGSGQYGMLGEDSHENQYEPRPITLLSELIVTQVSSYGHHTIVTGWTCEDNTSEAIRKRILASMYIEDCDVGLGEVSLSRQIFVRNCETRGRKQYLVGGHNYEVCSPTAIEYKPINPLSRKLDPIDAVRHWPPRSNKSDMLMNWDTMFSKTK